MITSKLQEISPSPTPISYPFLWRGYSKRIYLRVSSGDPGKDIKRRDVDVCMVDSSFTVPLTVGEATITGVYDNDAWKARLLASEAVVLTNAS